MVPQGIITGFRWKTEAAPRHVKKAKNKNQLNKEKRRRFVYLIYFIYLAVHSRPCVVQSEIRQ